MQLTFGVFIKRATVPLFGIILGHSGEGGVSASLLHCFVELGETKILNFRVNVYILGSFLVQLCQGSE